MTCLYFSPFIFHVGKKPYLARSIDVTNFVNTLSALKHSMFLDDGPDWYGFVFSCLFSNYVDVILGYSSLVSLNGFINTYTNKQHSGKDTCSIIM